jgi:hypothetical protein
MDGDLRLRLAGRRPGERALKGVENGEGEMR